MYLNFKSLILSGFSYSARSLSEISPRKILYRLNVLKAPLRNRTWYLRQRNRCGTSCRKQEGKGMCNRTWCFMGSGKTRKTWRKYTGFVELCAKLYIIMSWIRPLWPNSCWTPKPQYRRICSYLEVVSSKDKSR